MKKLLFILTIVLISATTWSQENMLTLSGGYALANLEETETDATGWRINGLYEFNPNEGVLSHGLSFGYIGTKAEFTEGAQTTEWKLNSYPVYYAPKVILGSKKLKGYLKGALGMHFSGYKRTGGTTGEEFKTNDTGFYGGLAIGGTMALKGSMFLMVEYEWAYLSNAYYRDNFMNTINAGLGVKF